jgi:hypothetical protein
VISLSFVVPFLLLYIVCVSKFFFRDKTGDFSVGVKPGLSQQKPLESGHQRSSAEPQDRNPRRSKASSGASVGVDDVLEVQREIVAYRLQQMQQQVQERGGVGKGSCQLNDDAFVAAVDWVEVSMLDCFGLRYLHEVSDLRIH